MSFEVAKKFIDDLLADKYFINTQRDKSIIMDFIGGEPLMEIDLIDAICTSGKPFWKVTNTPSDARKFLSIDTTS